MNMNLFSYVKTRVAILDVINQYTTIRKTGHYWKGCCPFHSEKTASFTVSPDKNIFYCFGCHAGGDVITFVAKAENLSPLQAAHHLVEQYSLTLPETLENPAKNMEKQFAQKKHYWHLCSLVAQWCHAMLLKSSTALSYFKKRGIDQSTITHFSIGYFPSGQRALKSLLEYVKPSHYLAQDLIEAGILAEGKAQLYSSFEERLLFPIRDHLGRFCGFGGRVFADNDERSKYYNSKENSFFLKGSLIFGFDLAKQSIQKHEAAFLVEGYMDCISMVQHGFINTIATLGTACTLDHLKTVSRYASTLYILYDGDDAGQKAILRLTELCWQVNLELKVIKFPKNEDPASFLHKGNDLKLLIAEAQDIFSFFIATLGADFCHKNLNEKVTLTQHLLKIIMTIEEPLKRDFLLQNAAQVFDIPFDSLKRELNEKISGHQQRSKAAVLEHKEPQHVLKTEANSPSLKTITELEKKLFSVIINNMGILEEEDWHFIDYFNEPLQDILKKITLVRKENPSNDFINFFELLTLGQKDLVTQLLLEFQEYTHEKNFHQLLTQFQKQHWKALVAVFKVKLFKAEQEGNKNLVQKLLQDFQKFKKKLVIDRGA
jgi:DNA primase